ncbi:hypothetical protein ACSL103130_10385 [Actinomyces slackii]|uniref:Uncharacterized protein n=1 Tax=Actinomyces slackii TaxID=52774 RepID=A0A3S4SJN3_9ACTO|nr:hypothetical protein [Actinomyces slackii]VEG74248.1 Uncharacterised protein [Actinomyces slackii]
MTDEGRAAEGWAARRAGRRRRVVALSARDRRRLAQGLEPEDLARPDYEHDPLATGAGQDERTGRAERAGRAGHAGHADDAKDSNDARLLADVPPHWQ